MNLLLSHRKCAAQRLLPIGLILAIAAAAGCATRGYEKAEATSDAVTLAVTQVDAAIRQTDDALAALHALVDRPLTDLKQPFERYRTATSNLEKTVEQVRVQTDAMAKQGQTYFNTWDARLAQMRNEDIRARSAARQREVTTQYADIQQRYQDARRQLELLMPNLRDIQSALGVDLTPAGIQSTREFVTKTDSNAAAAKRALSQLADAFRTLRATLAPAPGSPGTST